MGSKLIILALAASFLFGATGKNNEGGAATKLNDKVELMKQYKEFQAFVNDKITSIFKLVQNQEKEQSCSDEDRNGGKNSNCRKLPAGPLEQHDLDTLLARIQSIQHVLLVLLPRKLHTFSYIQNFSQVPAA